MTTFRCRKCTKRTLEGVEAEEDLPKGMVLATSLCKAQGGDEAHDWREIEALSAGATSAGGSAGSLQVQFAELIESVKQIKQIVPMVCNLMIDANNLWTNTQIADSVTERSDEFRKNLVSHLGYDISASKTSKKRLMFKCMVSDVVSSGQDIEAAHIAPARSNVKRLAHIGMTPADVSDVRNGLLLASGIHKAFDHLRLSFVKTNPLSEQLHLKIWDNTCRNIAVYPGARKTIGDCDGAELKLAFHQPFKRALSYPAYFAYLKFNFIPSNIRPDKYGSENGSAYYSGIQLMRDAVIQDMKYELDSEEEEDGEDASES